MRIAWWRGIQRLYLVAAALWVCAVVVLGLEDVRRPLHDEPILAMAVKCKAIQDKEFYGLPEEEQVKVYTAICPELETSYSRLSYGARIKMSTGHYQGRTQSDVQVESRQMVRQGVINLAALALGVPLVGYGLLLLGRWALRGFVQHGNKSGNTI